VSSRTYLSIGDVLTLLREEFPDVTISKIRFLESQGLVNPERSPSGYRKFFDHDVERLRWVLRQQREHFLPLKVIRDRLADGELDDTGAGAGAGAAAGAGAHAASEGGNGKPARAANAARPAAASAGSSLAATAAGAPVDEQPTKADEEAMARILADASRRSAQRPDAALTPGAGRPGLQVVDEAPAQAPPVDAPRAPESVPVPVGSGAALSGAARQSTGAGSSSAAGTPPAVAGNTSGASGAKGGEPSKSPAQPAPTKESNQASSGRGPSDAKGATRAGRHGAGAGAATGVGTEGGVGAGGGAAAGASSTTAMVTGASLTGEEVCAASGLSVEELAGLEGFGLITSVNVAGIPTYDEDALTLANLAAQFRAYGIEARHLRLYRNAVDRELGLIEQVIIPLLRQRNPESRQRAVETSDQLASLGQSMRATLLHQALRQHLGG
jgi:DNA-binding transcriptional MerR regulator